MEVLGPHRWQALGQALELSFGNRRARRSLLLRPVDACLDTPHFVQRAVPQGSHPLPFERQPRPRGPGASPSPSPARGARALL